MSLYSIVRKVRSGFSRCARRMCSAGVEKPVFDRFSGGAEYGSHFIPLAFACSITSGPVLELGCGDYSTPLLHVLCSLHGRQVMTFDTDKNWLELFEPLQSEMHTLHYVPVYEDDWAKNPRPEQWDQISIPECRWGVVFVDHRPGERRRIDISRFKDKAELIVVHDSQESSYGYEEVFRDFRYRLDYKRFPTWTTIVSQDIDVSRYVF